MPALTLSAVRVSATSAAWTISASVASIILGMATGSLALIAFGGVQLFDFAADVVLVIHFRGGPEVEHLERVVLRVVALGLIAVSTTTVVYSVLHLLHGHSADDSTASVALSAMSLVALAALAARKRYLADRLPSAALRADGNLSAVGAALAAVTLIGVSTARAFGWWWADPVAALLIALGAFGLGATTYPRSATPARSGH